MSTDNKPKVGAYDPNSLSNRGYVKRKYFRIQEGKSNIYRVLPPFGSLAESSPTKIAAYHAIFFLKGASGKNRPVKTIMEKGRDGTYLRRCPIFDKVEALKVQLNAIAQDPNYDQNLVKAKAEQLDSLRLDKSYYVNVMNQAGEIGVLSMRYTAYQSLKKRLEELASEGIDPISPGPNNGVFFDFKRYKNDQGRVVYEVETSTRTKRDETGRPVKEYNWAPIDDQVLKRMETEASDLGKMYKTFSLEEMNLLATLDPKTIDSVLAKPEAAKEDEFDGDDFDAAQSTAAPVVNAAAAAARAQTNTTSTVSSVSSNMNSKVPAAQRQTLDANDLVNQFLRSK